MDDEALDALVALIRSRKTASLGTLHDGAPAVSMVPFAIAANGSVVVHVSGLSQHTVDMRRDPRVSLMIVEAEVASATLLALSRVSIRAEAAELSRDGDGYRASREAYLERHPDAGDLFGFADFALFALKPIDARFVAGFGRAFRVGADALTDALVRARAGF